MLSFSVGILNSLPSAEGARMSVDRGVEDLPEAGSAPLIIDAEFTEVEDKVCRL